MKISFITFCLISLIPAVSFGVILGPSPHRDHYKTACQVTIKTLQDELIKFDVTHAGADLRSMNVSPQVFIEVLAGIRKYNDPMSFTSPASNPSDDDIVFTYKGNDYVGCLEDWYFYFNEDNELTNPVHLAMNKFGRFYEFARRDDKTESITIPYTVIKKDNRYVFTDKQGQTPVKVKRGDTAWKAYTFSDNGELILRHGTFVFDESMNLIESDIINNELPLGLLTVGVVLFPPIVFVLTLFEAPLSNLAIAIASFSAFLVAMWYLTRRYAWLKRPMRWLKIFWIVQLGFALLMLLG